MDLEPAQPAETSPVASTERRPPRIRRLGASMKILALASTLDLKYGLGCTPSWWQLLKGFHEIGNEVIAIPYLGDPVQSLWWRVYRNPCSRQSKLFNALSKVRSDHLNGKVGPSAAVSKFLVKNHIRPRW